MHCLDIDAEGRSDVPHRTKSCGQICPLDRYERSMIDVNRIRSRRGKFAPIESGMARCNHRPRVRVGRPFAGEVSGVEFRERGVDVVGLDHHDFRNSVVVVDLDNGERRNGKRLRPTVFACEDETNEGEALSADRNGRPHINGPEVVSGPPVRHLEISTASDSGVYHPTPIV